MYDFHKKRNNPAGNIFMNKYFVRGQEHLLKLIKRKNNSKDNHNENKNEEEYGLVQYYAKELSSKKITKIELEKILRYLVKSLNDTTDRQKVLECKVESLGKQNEEFILQNQQMLKDIINKK